MLNKPNINELCPGELTDYVLELVKRDLKNIPSDHRCRRKDLAEAILSCNKETGNRQEIRDALSKEVLNWSPSSGSHLTRYGIATIKGRTHYKIKWGAYCVSIAASPSDRRSLINTRSDAEHTFF